MKDYKGYLLALEISNKQQEARVESWLGHNLVNYLKEHTEDQDQIEHIIDYLVSDESPLNLVKMSYDAANKNAQKWTKKLIKKGEHIKESKSDIKIIHDFKDGFKIVQLIGKKAYEREGYLMRNCVASYFGKSTEIYSLRDKDNMPHATFEVEK